MMNHYETAFILTPVLSDVQMKEAVENSKNFWLKKVQKLRMKNAGV